MEQEEYEEVTNGLVMRGGFGAVRPVKRKLDGKVLACKHIAFDRSRYRTQLDFKERVEKEINLLKYLDHPNIVRYYDKQLVAGGQAFKIYTEWLQDQNLDSYISTQYSKPDWPSEKETWSLTCQLSAALAYCHKGLIRDKASLNRASRIFNQRPWNLVLHRDVKPDNVLVQCKASGQVVFKLCDFGLSIIPCETEQLSFGGTNLYIAPEVTRDDPQWSDKADIFALGCTLFYFYKRDAPWRYQLTLTSSVSMPVLPKHAGQDIKDLIYACISTDAKNRPDAEQIFMKALENLEEEDRSLASVETSHTMSDIGPQSLSLRNPDSLSKSTPVRPSSPLAQADKPSDGSRFTAALTRTQHQIGVEPPTISHSVPPADNAPPRRAADSFFKIDPASVLSESAPVSGSSTPPRVPKMNDKTETQSTWARLKSSIGRKRSGKASIDTKGRYAKDSSVAESIQSTPDSEPHSRTKAPTSFASTSSSRIGESVSKDFGRGNSDEEIGSLIGSLAVDYHRYPPLDMFHDSRPIKKNVYAIHLGEDMKFSHSHFDTGPPSKRLLTDRLLSTSSKAGSSGTEVSVEVELDRAREFQLENFEEYFDELMEDYAPLIWVRRKKLQNRRVFLVVGYIVYTNTRVREAGGRTGAAGISTSASAQVVGVPVSVGSISGEASTAKQYDKRGDQTQAVYAREILPGKGGDEFSLGEIEIAYFWGPRVHPLSA
ncbi:kinase-like domain-containing protein [Pyrenochaeta sp. MPI-SDFR-AT-0127]|nr:kinase-like domain-containing protein [Pyrenochaeta sp. MPI-SDFR-AT-0127]